MSERFDLVVVGGGLIGLACAWRARQRGLETCVLDAGDPGNASRAAAGMLAPASEVGESAPEIAALGKASYEAYPAFVAELEEAGGVGAAFRVCGVLQVALDGAGVAQLEEMHAVQRAAGLATELLDGPACRAREPGLAEAVVAGIWSGEEAQVDPAALVEGLEVACRRAGVVLRARTRVDAAEIEGERIQAVAAGGERFEAERFLLATGAHTGEQTWLPPGVRPAVGPVKGQLVRGRLPAPPASALVRSGHAYVVSRADGRVVVGASSEHAGFDDTPSPETRARLLAAAVALLPALAALEDVHDVVGFRPSTPDGLPVVGRTELENLLVATGHYRNGVLLAPLTADTIAALLAS